MEDAPRWSRVLRALREARGVTQDGWAARLGVSRATVQRWESGERAPDPEAENQILISCREAGLFRRFDHGPLAGLSLNADSLRDLLAEGRLGSSRSAADPSGRQAAPAPIAVAGERAAAGGMAPRAEPALRQTNLPAALSSFVGRQSEIAALRRLLGGTRLLTLTGVGGCGKTRLALQLAGELLWAYPHGIWLADLAALGDPELVPQTVARALSLRPTGEQPVLDMLCEHLAARHLLLILDNCEHLLPACAEFAEALLRACPHLEVLATSREPLGIIGETIWRVPPLSLPDGGDREQGTGDRGQGTGDRDEAMVASPSFPMSMGREGRGAVGPTPAQSSVLSPQSSDAVRLFVERAQQYKPGFVLRPDTESAVVQICRRLDGIPLAIELAAARVSALSTEQIATRLADRFRLLTGGSRTALPRQQTLRATLDWSYGLLDEPERAALRRLSVFVGGFTLEAAEAIVAGENAVDLLMHLVDKSLVIAELQDGAARYRMLETVRQYGDEKLAEAGEAEATGTRHVAWCLVLADAAADNYRGPDQGTWLNLLDREYSNIRAALSWCLSAEHAATLGLRLASRLPWFWEVRGYLAEGRRWLEELLAGGEAAPADVRCSALDGAGVLARNQGDLAAAIRLHKQSVALARELNDEPLIARSLNGLAIAVAWAGDLPQAQALFEEGLELQQKLGNQWAVAVILMDLGNVASDKGDEERAAALYEQALPLAREQGDRRLVATLLQNLGNRYRNRGALDLAAARYHEGLSVYRELHDQIGIVRCLRVIAHLTLDRGDMARVARLCGAAAALREKHGVGFEARGNQAFERTRAAACEALGEAAFATEWAAGQAMSHEQAVAEALAATADPQLSQK
jgi:predicted ATPase/transcriptional regulator with XRE-family HTH domain